jgi:hypothetical protein
LGLQDNVPVQDRLELHCLLLCLPAFFCCCFKPAGLVFSTSIIVLHYRNCSCILVSTSVVGSVFRLGSTAAADGVDDADNNVFD